VTRSLLVAGVVAAALGAPSIALAAPAGGLAVVRAAPASNQAPARSAGTQRSAQDPFKVPFDVEVRPAQLPESAQYRLDPYDSQPREFETAPGYVLYQPACLGNGYWSPSGGLTSPGGGSSPPSDFTVGSLVDQRSENLFSSTPSYTGGSTGLATLGDSAAAASSPLSFQYGVGSAPCGAGFVP
jgi:hypothetical protein